MRKLGMLVLLVALALTLATFGAGWKWGKNGSHTRQAGWTWDDGAASYVWSDA